MYIYTVPSAKRRAVSIAASAGNAKSVPTLVDLVALFSASFDSSECTRLRSWQSGLDVIVADLRPVPIANHLRLASTNGTGARTTASDEINGCCHGRRVCCRPG